MTKRRLLLDALKAIDTLSKDYSVTVYTEDECTEYDLTDQRDMWFCIRILELMNHHGMSLKVATEQYMSYVEIEGCSHRCTQCHNCYKGLCMMYKVKSQTWDHYLREIEPQSIFAKELIRLVDLREGNPDDILLLPDLIKLVESEEVA